MNTESPATCALGLDAETLSTYRSAGLASDEMARITAHVAGCVTCQARLAEYEAMGAALVAQRVPAPDERLWRGVRAGMASRPQRSWSMPSQPTRRLFSGLCAVAAVLIIVVGFANLLQRRGTPPPTGTTPTATASVTATTAAPTPTPSPTPFPTVIPATHALDWQAVPMPPGFDPRLLSTNIFAPSPADGRTAYACDEPLNATSKPQPAVWVTHDLGADWTRVSDFPSPPTGWCSFIVDQLDPNIVLLGLSNGPPMQGPPGADHYFASLDGGATWRAVPGLQGPNVSELITVRGTTYVIALSDPATAEGDLLASTDDLRTWQPTAPQGSELAQHAQRLWADPASGDLLAEATPAEQQTHLFTSADGGQHWTQLTGTGMPETGYFSVRASSGQPWHICAAVNDSTMTTSVSRITCSADGGRTWTTRVAWSDGGPNASNPGTFTYAADGSLLAGVVVQGASGRDAFEVWRLTPGAKAWQSLGPMAQLALGYSAGPAPGRLWALPYPMMGSTDPQGRIFTVIYGG